MAATTTSETDSQSSQAKSKLDNLSREDLIRFVKKQLEHVNIYKQKVKELNASLADKDNSIHELQIENAGLKETLQVRCPYGNEEILENGKPPEGTRSVREESSELAKEIDHLKSERMRFEEELSATQQANSFLRSQLDEVQLEVTTLREQQKATDVFSLELKDYEKKMVQLNKALSEAESALEAAKGEKEDLALQLSAHKESSDRAISECSELQKQLREVKSELNEERSRGRDQAAVVDRLQDNINVLVTTKNDELTSLEAKVTKLEELAQILQRSNEQKSTKIESLLAENQMLKTSCENLKADFKSYKSRARYVLEQQAKTAGSEKTNPTEREAQLEEKLAGFSRELDELQAAQKRVLDENRRYRDLSEKNETLARNVRAQVLEAQKETLKANEELLDCQMKLKLCESQCQQLQKQNAELEKQMHEEGLEKEKKIRALHDEVSSRAVAEAEMSSELERERNRCEEALRRLTELQKECARPLVASPAFPIYSNHEHEHSVDNYSPSEMVGRTSRISANILKEEEDEPERSLADVLFGDDNLETPSRYNDTSTVRSMQELKDENERLKKNLSHTSELLNESEATNATLVEQSHLLKEEIRRLERNEERLHHIENSEYLKNIIMKFLCPERVSGERAQLVPILTTMLSLSPEETERLTRIAAEDESNRRQPERSWGSYLRWGHLN